MDITLAEKFNNHLGLTSFRLKLEDGAVGDVIRYLCLECLGIELYIKVKELKDGFPAYLHYCSKCHARMEYSGSN
jgi:hypothetical protein